ncbi:mCG1025537, partial [Mus musculus]
WPRDPEHRRRRSTRTPDHGADFPDLGLLFDCLQRRVGIGSSPPTQSRPPGELPDRYLLKRMQPVPT